MPQALTPGIGCAQGRRNADNLVHRIEKPQFCSRLVVAFGFPNFWILFVRTL